MANQYPPKPLTLDDSLLSHHIRFYQNEVTHSYDMMYHDRNRLQYWLDRGKYAEQVLGALEAFSAFIGKESP